MEELPGAKEGYLAGRREEEGRARREGERVGRERREEREGWERGWEELRGGEGRSNVVGFDEEDFM